HVRFTDIDKVSIGTRVTYAGKPIGEVIAIDEIKDRDTARTDESGRIFIYDLTLRVDSGFRVYDSDQISIRTSGLLGEKNVDITPLAPKAGKKAQDITKVEVIYGEPSGTVEETFKEFKETANKLEVALDTATKIMDNIRENKLVDKITKTVEN